MPLYHVWFATKRRKWMLQGDILDAVREEIGLAAERHGIRVLEHEAVVDHVHMLLQLEDGSSLAKAMNLIKGASARRVFQRFPELKLDAHTSSFWQAKYAFKEIPPEREHAVRKSSGHSGIAWKITLVNLVSSRCPAFQAGVLHRLPRRPIAQLQELLHANVRQLCPAPRADAASHR